MAFSSSRISRPAICSQQLMGFGTDSGYVRVRGAPDVPILPDKLSYCVGEGCQEIGCVYTTGSPCTSTSSGSTPARAGSGSLPRQLADPQKRAVLALRHPATAPIVRGSTLTEAAPASAIEIIIVIHVQLSMVENTRPRYSFDT